LFNFDNSYTRLPKNFYAQEKADDFPQVALIQYNRELAQNVLGINLDELSEDELAAIFSGKSTPTGANPVALAYAGHQFGHGVPVLGDGRAMLLGEIVNPKGQRFDIQLKGSGRTTYSRGGDGRSSLGPVIREYIMSEAMHKLGVPTTRALAAITTGDTVWREDELPAGVFTRVASSHIRFGTFEYFLNQNDKAGLKTLADYAIDRHYPECGNADNPYLEFLKSVSHSQAKLVSKWLSLGFIHGVMNTDNMTISGETLDYGPCAFMDTYESDKVFSSIDRRGRYAYKNQMPILQWNLQLLASCLIPLIDTDEDKAVEKIKRSMSSYENIYTDFYNCAMAKKLGFNEVNEKTISLMESLLKILENEGLDFTNSFAQIRLMNPSDEFLKITGVTSWIENWKNELSIAAVSQEAAIALMKQSNPVIIPRNHQVEKCIQGGLKGDFSLFRRMNQAMLAPYDSIDDFSEFHLAPEVNETVQATFCGT
jgi:uncharacterized protein YdiU (UPF0061 family)